ncbi:MAG: HU family DNA-binding protein [Candidatus Cloacimonetes bacterium]|nr:HU family DNA-binding protein [Candidatus Cloacimonadota bacterium]
MSIKFNLVPRGNPGDVNAPKKFYATVKSDGKRNLNYLARRIADISTVSPIDTKAVLEALIMVVPEELADGKNVKLGDFGTFRVVASSEGVLTEDEFTTSKIKNVKISFTKGVKLKERINNFRFEKLPTQIKK